MKALYMILAVLAAVILTGCGEKGGIYTGAFNSPQAGGVMQLVQQGNAVTGTYPGNGRLEGTAEGNRLDFRWWQGAGAENGFDAAKQTARGEGYFVMDEDGGGFDGKYRLEGRTGWSDDWYGIRSRD